jgi:hypothetical protein
MKTKHLVEILRCPGDHRANCEKCKALESCKELACQDLCEVCAERLEQLLDNLRRTEAELKEAKALALTYEKRYNRFLHNMQEVVHEQEIIGGFGS